ncbi:hypothetical protein N864_19005 [Intrasporangium chromatireducens Q5-1]|uniref:Uncharacterized protein n=1 Tax=Intrasporangium chromatireducens Q5-1 TaxID=584657 RepID=W9GET1_9MICO|nr:hypothetical protein N864_19005 [Intrasporangium chromatireducens Q5-1]
MVEILAALRDHERGCYADTAAPTAGMEFIRALYDARRVLEDLVSRTGCTPFEHRADRPWAALGSSAASPARTPRF